MKNDLTDVASVDWEQLGTALAGLEDEIGEKDGARVTLVQWARAGDLRTMASRAIGFFEGRTLDERDWPIPVEFWQRLRAHEDFAWATGNLGLALHDSPKYDSRRHGKMAAPQVTDVRIDAEDLERMRNSLPPRVSASSNLTTPPQSRGGRRPANWWPSFAEELAVHLHFDGLPEGHDAEGTDQVRQIVSSKVGTHINVSDGTDNGVTRACPASMPA